LARAPVVLQNKERRKADDEKKKEFDRYVNTRARRKIIQRQREKKQKKRKRHTVFKTGNGRLHYMRATFSTSFKE
jgi:hypothetical protein